jgi:hypothetical protein
MMRGEANGEAEQREELSCGRQWAVQLSPKRRAWEVAQSRETLILRSAFRTSGPRTCSTPVAGHWHARWHSACVVVSSLRNALRGWPIAQCNSVHHSSVPAADFNSQGCQCTGLYSELLELNPAQPQAKVKGLLAPGTAADTVAAALIRGDSDRVAWAFLTLAWHVRLGLGVTVGHLRLWWPSSLIDQPASPRSGKVLAFSHFQIHRATSSRGS